MFPQWNRNYLILAIWKENEEIETSSMLSNLVAGTFDSFKLKNTIEWGIYSFTNKIFNYPDTLPGGFQVKVLMLFELWKPT